MLYTDLSIYSGNPAFSSMLHVGRPNIGNRQRFLDLINDMLDRRWFSNEGPYVKEFEKRIVEYLGVKHCIAMCNGTIALEIAIRALELKGEVIVPSFTFIATAHSLQWQEVTPVFCDIDHRTHHLDPKAIEKMITPRTSGILGVHTWGRPCDIEALSEVTHKYNLKLLFDAAHAFGCSYKGKMIGNFGNAEVFSFHATKFFNTFEGGAVVTDNDDLAIKIRLMKNFGFAGYDNVIYIGTNGKMNEASAAMGLTNLESMDEFIAINLSNYKCYHSHLNDIPGINILQYDDSEKQNYQYIILEVDESKAGLSRDELLKILHAENVLARRYFYPGCHNMEPYRSYFPHSYLLLSDTDKLSQCVLVLPTGTSVTSDQISVICLIIRTAVKYAKQVKEILYSI
ncbi:MAG: aminotransferase class I/II-fold pyridoxal phosphate-dependent enzyme [Syntrophales bacterium]